MDTTQTHAKTPAIDPSTLGNDSRMAKAIVWLMVATHPQWLQSDNNVTVPYEAIDTALKLTRGTTQVIWNLARSSPDMYRVSAAFETNFPPVGVVAPGEWPGGSCGLVVDFVQLLDPSADPATFPSVDILP